MIKKNVTDEELFYISCFYNPKCMLESLYPQGAMRDWDEAGECLKVRPYQRPFLALDGVLEDDDRLDDFENFQRRVKLGTKYIILARKLGKTFIALVGNIILKMVYYSGKEMTFSAYDEKHMSKVMDVIRSFFTSHSFFKQYKEAIKGSPEYKIETKNGNIFYGINETIKGKDPGTNWWGHHTDFNFTDEIQAETEAAFNKKIDAIGEKGCAEVLVGIPLVTKVSPLGKILKDARKQKQILRLPQYASPYWNAATREERERQYGGTNTVCYKVNVSAELVEGAEGAFDMERVRANYQTDKAIKAFEITKENYPRFKSELIVDSHKSAERTYIHADIGGNAAATEIGITFKVNGRYQLVYNITTWKLDDKENAELMIWLFNKVGANFIAVDATIMGAPIYRQLSEKLDLVIDDKILKRVIWCAFNENIVVGFKKDEKDPKKLAVDGNGKPIPEEEHTLIFAVQRLRTLFFDKQFIIPDNFIKFDEQFSDYLQIVSQNKVMFDSRNGEDHLVQCMQVFAILEWLTEQMPLLTKEAKPKKTSLGIWS
jgi:hypothetical protein